MLAACSASVARTQGAQGKGRAIVVGAGISGLAAASALRAKGWEVSVIEARDRIGGRIHTDRSLGGIPMELGAQWIHGSEGNPLVAVARKAGAKLATSERERQRLYNFRGEFVGDATAQSLIEKWDDVREPVVIEHARADEDTSLAELLQEAIDDAGLSQFEEQAVRFFISDQIENPSAANIADLDARMWRAQPAFEGDDVVLGTGFDGLATWLSRGLDIKLGHAVKAVRHDPAGVTVVTDQGEHAADAAVITLPLGVLKAGKVAFEPALPTAMTEAIDRLGVGALHKVLLHFPKAFWPEQQHFFGYMGTRGGEWASWANLEPMLDAAVLCATNSGRFARELEAMPAEDVVKLACETLRKMFGESFVEPDGFRITQWGRDPWALGAWAHVPPKASGDDIDALAQPVGNRLFLAGEATHRKYPGTLHGAYLSGLRAANELLRHAAK